jgi:hypothetical protein
MGTEAYECVGGPLDGSRVRLNAAEDGIFSKTEKLPSGEHVKHWYALLTRVDTIHQRCVMFFSYRGTDKERIWDHPVVAPPYDTEEV